MPRTSRTRKEIEEQIFKEYVMERQDAKAPFSLEAIQVELLLDIRDAVMEGKKRGPNESADINHT